MGLMWYMIRRELVAHLHLENLSWVFCGEIKGSCGLFVLEDVLCFIFSKRPKPH